jgi:hypothetical protein
MSSFHCASALLSFGTISVRGAFCFFFCRRFLVCDADCTSLPYFLSGLEGVLGINVPVLPLELDKMAAEGVLRCTWGVEAMIASEFDEVRRKL